MTHPILKKKLAQLKEYLDKLAPYVALSSDVLLHNEEKRVAMERWFQLAVDEAIDINTALIYQGGGAIPESYKSTFHDLAELGIITHNFAEQIAESAKVRNRIIHDYEKMQYSDMIESIKKFFEMYIVYMQILIKKFVNKK